MTIMQVAHTSECTDRKVHWQTPGFQPKIALAAALLLAASMNLAGAAEGRSLTLYSAYRDGGSFQNQTTGKSASIGSSAAYSASLEFPLDASRQFQVLYSYQKSSLGLESPLSGATPANGGFPLQIMYLQLGGTSFLTGEIGHGTYLVGGLGAALFDPTAAGYDSELRFAANLGLGYQQPLGKHLALRFEARGYFSLINSSGGLFCNGGCTLAIAGDAVAQGELSIGLAFSL